MVSPRSPEFLPAKRPVVAPGTYEQVLDNITSLLSEARSTVNRNVNMVMTVAYWQIGHHIVENERHGSQRAGYGEELVARLAHDLTARFGRGFSKRNLHQMQQFRLVWTPEKIVQTLSAQSGNALGGQISTAMLTKVFRLPWSSYVRLLSVKNEQARAFYEAEALRGGWTVRQLTRQIDSMFYERTALSLDKAAMRSRSAPDDGGPSPDEAIKDPFVLEFLNLKDEYSETDIEEALIAHLADFLLELGGDFTFVAKQRRLRLDDSWFRVDLTMYHRRLRALVLIELKLGRFSYQDAGQMHLYLNYAREHWTLPDENPPVGLILCAQKGADEAHYALEGLPNKVLASEYLLALPEEKALVAELARSRAELESRTVPTEDTQ